ncbi:MAG TPA: hypothetical protein VMU74_06885 [Gaiellaceae bacterium]|nr:hypothetical protein [Gaiellaceae bacterium]
MRDRHEVDACSLRAVDGEQVDLAVITPFLDERAAMMSVGTADVEHHRSLAKASGLALDTIDKTVAFEHEIATGVLPVRDVEANIRASGAPV